MMRFIGFKKPTLFYMAAVLLLINIIPALGQKISAQVEDSSFNIVTSPLPINLQAKPGTTISTDIKIKNGGTKTEKLKVSLMKFAAYGEEGKPSIQEKQPGDDYFDWVSFSPQVFDAPPNEWITVKMTIRLPQSAAFGYYYAAVFSRANQAKPASSKENVLVGSTAVLVLLDAQVPGAKRNAAINSFKADKKFYEFLPSNFKVSIRNTGNVHVIPTGNIFIKKGSKTVATLEVNTAAGNVLPKSNRIFSADWPEGFPAYVVKEENGKVVLDENGKPIKSLDWDISKIGKLRFGKYNAQLVLAYDNGTRDVPMEASVSFWVVPVRIIVVGAIVLLLVGVGLWSVMKKAANKIPKRAKKAETK